MNRRKVAKALRHLREQVLAGTHSRLGICYNVHALLYGAVTYQELSEVFEGWPGHSGNKDYPVAVPPYEVRFANPQYRWKGEQREARLSLIDYSIAKLEASYASV